MKIEKTVLTKKGNYFSVMLPAKRVICDRCDGTGVHDHPAFANGVEGLDDPDFSESYFKGHYDVPCSVCEGQKVILVVDEERISEKMLKRYDRYLDQVAADEREARNERRWMA